MEYGQTAYNRSVYAGLQETATSGLTARSVATPPRLIPAHFSSPGRASCGSDAAQSLYPGWQNVVNSRNVTCIVPVLFSLPPSFP
jgi:hypothetical protein